MRRFAALFPLLMKTLSAKRLSRRILAALLLMNLSACSIGMDDSKEVLVRVNESAITLGEYRDALKRLIPAEEAQEEEGLAELKKELVNELVEEELLVQEASRQGVEVTEKELAAEVDVIRKEYGDESFKSVIEERYGSLEGWEKKIKRKLLVKKAVERITGPVKVPDSEAEAWYRENKGEFERPEQVRARMIVVASAEEAAKVRQRLTVKNFAEVAKELSLSPEGRGGGDLGFFGKGDMPEEFEAAVFSLKPGQISPVVRTDYGFHIFLLDEKRNKGVPAYTEVRDKIIERLKTEKASKLLGDWMSARKRLSRIEVREELL